MKKLYLFLLILISVGCSQQKSDNDGPTVVKMNLRKVPDAKATEEFIQRFASIRLMPLETREESIMNSRRPVISEEGIFTLDYVQSSIFYFNPEGKYIAKLQRPGEGPEEYISIRGLAVQNGCIYILDEVKIQVYDLEGNHLKRIPVDRASDLMITPDGKYVTVGAFNQDYILKVYDENGKTGNYFPGMEKMKDLIYVRPASYTMGWHQGGVYFCQYYDHTIYYLKNGEVRPLYSFDLGSDRIPEDAFEGSVEQKSSILEGDKDKMVVALVNLTMTDDWIVFCPEKWFDSKIVYYNIKEDRYFMNLSLPYPYSELFGGYKVPHGYVNGEFYFLITALEVKDMIEELQERGKLDDYYFLKDIDPAAIDEEDNPWVVYFSLS